VFPEGSFALAGLWWGAAVVWAVYFALFLLAHRPVTLRLLRLGGLALVVAGLRLLLIPCGDSLANPLDIGLTVLTVLGGVVLWCCGRVWLARAEATMLREQIHTACRGLFLEYSEPRTGHLLLAARGGTWRLRLVGLSPRVQLVVLPPVTGPSKAALLLHWLSKQYPGPVPRLHIVLKKE
jgi:hypothetical protein